ncbi:Ldh family oxidoreductase [Vannielia litorea]|uniref:Ldh family oxidoreductase n=1 Tax=Vannielia litorea TaxID=1217970 RepID=UPI001BCC99AF|nr:Ldh family oxidoreductase [Vannielia litorea]MBS8227199.1 Ldh family oxidoreductase [Vannielia litorea]
MTSIRPEDLKHFVAALLQAAGMEAEKAGVTAEVLVEGEMIGRATHGVGLVPWYLSELSSGALAGTGSHEVIRDRGATFVWEGNCLPGAWLVTKGLDLAAERARQYGTASGAIRNAHHTCALAAYMRPLTDQGLVVRITASNPAAARMAPFGGTRPLLTPNPIAVGFPTSAHPIVVDVSCSITTTTMTQTLAGRGERYPGQWALTAAGQPTDDPREVTEHGGTLLPIGGTSKGYKGFGLAVIEDLMSQGLSGKGRANTPAGPLSQSIFLQVWDPDAFAGTDALVLQSDHLANACRENPPANPSRPVRIPGDQAAVLRERALTEGLQIPDETIATLNDEAKSRGLGILANH